MNKKLRNALIITGSVLATVFIALGVLITDFTDNTPDYISEVDGQTPGDYLGAKAETAFKDAGLLDDIEYLFTEHEINDLLATVVPSIKVPMVSFKSIYVDIKDDNSIRAEAPIWAACYKSCGKIDGYLSYDDTTVTLRLTDVKVNLLNSKFGIVDWILSEKTVKNIQKSINDAGVYLTMEKDGKDIVATMTNLDICKTIAECSNSASGVLTAAIVGGVISSRNVEIVVNENQLTGVIIHKKFL